MGTVVTCAALGSVAPQCTNADFFIKTFFVQLFQSVYNSFSGKSLSEKVDAFFKESFTLVKKEKTVVFDDAKGTLEESSWLLKLKNGYTFPIKMEKSVFKNDVFHKFKITVFGETHLVDSYKKMENFEEWFNKKKLTVGKDVESLEYIYERSGFEILKNENSRYVGLNVPKNFDFSFKGKSISAVVYDVKTSDFLLKVAGFGEENLANAQKTGKLDDFLSAVQKAENIVIEGEKEKEEFFKELLRQKSTFYTKFLNKAKESLCKAIGVDIEWKNKADDYFTGCKGEYYIDNFFVPVSLDITALGNSVQCGVHLGSVYFLLESLDSIEADIKKKVDEIANQCRSCMYEFEKFSKTGKFEVVLPKTKSLGGSCLEIVPKGRIFCRFENGEEFEIHSIDFSPMENSFTVYFCGEAVRYRSFLRSCSIPDEREKADKFLSGLYEKINSPVLAGENKIIVVPD